LTPVKYRFPDYCAVLFVGCLAHSWYNFGLWRTERQTRGDIAYSVYAECISLQITYRAIRLPHSIWRTNN